MKKILIGRSDLLVKVKTFYSASTTTLDNKINSFLENNQIKVVDIKFNGSLFYVYAMVLYKED